MSQAWQALLLSIFVLPGLAQVRLGKPHRGYLLIILVIGLVTAVAVNAVSLALEVMAPYTRSGLIPDPELIYQALQQAIYSAEEGWMPWALRLLASCWLFASIDGFLLGRMKDRSLKNKGKG